MLKRIKRYISMSDYVIFSVAILLSVCGVLAIFSAGYDPATQSVEDFYKKQIIWISAGIVMFFITSFISYKKIVRLAPFIYTLGVIMLIAVLISGHIGMGAQRWLGVGAFRIQPSEIFKVVWVITLAWVFIDFESKPLSFFKVIKKGILLAIPFYLVYEQPDMGTSLTYVAVWGCVVLLLGVGKKTFLVFVVIIAVVVPILWGSMMDYQKQRVFTFMNPERDPFGTGYHVIQSKIGIGSGGIDGKGYLKGTQSHLRFIPERHTDFIYSVISEEFGFIGGIAILGLFTVLLLRILKIAVFVKEPAGKILCFAVAAYIFFQFTVNSYMTVGMMPVVGIPMPFVSYGGSSLMSFFTMIGLVNSVHIRRFVSMEE